MRLPFELISYKIISGKSDRTKKYTIVEGLATLPNGQKTFCEAFLQGESHFQPGLYALEIEIYSDRNRRLSINVKGIVQHNPAAVSQKAAA